MPAAHHFPGEGPDRKVVNQTLQDRVATRPADAVQYYIAPADRRHETIRRKSRQEDAVICGVETGRFERAIDPGPKHRRDAGAAPKLDKCELAVGNRSRNTREHFLKLRQGFLQRVPRPTYPP